MFLDINLIIISILTLLVILELFLILLLKKRMQKLLMGTKAQNLEQAMNILGHHVEKLEHDRDIIFDHLKNVDKKLARSIRNVETIRFNPFPDLGGNQSFAMSMLNDNGDGVILSSLYARDRVSIFAKPIISGKPTQDLTQEEKEVFEKSKKII